MTKEDIFAKVKELIVESIGVDAEKVTEGASLTEDLGADSLELVDLTMDFEDELGVSIETAELADVDTVGDIINLIAAKMKKSA